MNGGEGVLRNVTRGTVIARCPQVARGFLARGRGLLGRSALDPEEALVISSCGSIHTFGMRFPIDVIFLDRGGRCLHVARDLRPGHIGPLVRGARTVIELAAGRVGETVRGDQITWGD